MLVSAFANPKETVKSTGVCLFVCLFVINGDNIGSSLLVVDYGLSLSQKQLSFLQRQSERIESFIEIFVSCNCSINFRKTHLSKKEETFE